MGKVVFAAGLYATLALAAGASADTVGNGGAIADRIGVWDTVAYNGIVLSVDGKMQYVAREWSEPGSTVPYKDRKGPAGLEGDLFRFIGKDGEDLVDLKSDSVSEINKKLFRSGSILQVSDRLEMGIDTADLKINLESSEYTIALSFAEDGSWQKEQYYFVGSDVAGDSDAERAARMIGRGDVISTDSFGRGSSSDWDGPSMKMCITSARRVKLEPMDGSCGVAEVPVYHVDGKWVVGSELPSATPDSEERAFSGWYTEEEGGEPVSLGSEFDESVAVLYAHYSDLDDRKDESVSPVDSFDVGTVLAVDGVKYRIQDLAGGSGTASVCGTDGKGIVRAGIHGSFTVDGRRIRVEGVGKGAFSGCSKLQYVSIGSDVRKIGQKAFKGCRSLRRIRVRSRVLYRIGGKAFKGVPKECVFVLPRGKKAQYVKMIRAARK